MNELIAGFITKTYVYWSLKSKLDAQNISIYDFAGLLSIIDEDLPSNHWEDHFSRDIY